MKLFLPAFLILWTWLPLRGAALPALKTLYLHNNPASQAARDVVQSALNSAEESDDERGEVSV